MGAHRLGWLAAAVVWLLTTSASVHAAPNTWPFDFDPQLADDPAALQQGLSELGQGLPGLRDDELTEVELGPVRLYFFTHLADALERAVTAGPQVMPDVTRTPVTCSAHAVFTYPNLLTPGPSSSCIAAEQSIAAAFEDNDQTCLQVEFPETYVFEHPPGEVTVSTVSSFEGLIAVAGEALSHLDIPLGLLPSNFLSRLRPIIAKIRYQTLIARLDSRSSAYTTALSELSSSAACFDAGAQAALVSTIATLQSELAQARQQLELLYQDGLARAADDRAAMRAQCRDRQELPHPALTDDERILLSFYIGGIYWRARGAGLLAYPPDPEQGLWRRMLYVGYPYQLIGDLTGGVDGDGVGNNILIDENWGWDEWWDMGTTPGSADKYSDLVGMTKRGKRGVNLVGPQVEGRGYDIRSLVAGGMQMGPCYYFAWEQLADFRLGEDLQDPYMWFIEWPTSLGEFCAGAALAEGLARTLLWGTTIPPEECVDPCADGACADAGVNVNIDGGQSCGPCPDGQACNADGVCEPLGEPGVDPDPDANVGGGCGCSAGAATGGLWWMVMLCWLLGRIRRSGSPG